MNVDLTKPIFPSKTDFLTTEMHPDTERHTVELIVPTSEEGDALFRLVEASPRMLAWMKRELNFTGSLEDKPAHLEAGRAIIAEIEG